MDFLANHVEALIFCASEPIHLEEIRQTMTEMFEADVPEEAIAAALALLKEKYQSDIYSFEVINSGGGYQFLTKPAYQASIGIWLKQKSKKRLCTAPPRKRTHLYQRQGRSRRPPLALWYQREVYGLLRHQ